MNFEEILSRCIIEMERGASIEECLSPYPAYAHDLEPLLRVAIGLRQVSPVRMSNSAFARGQQALRAQLQENRRNNELAQHRRPPFLRSYRTTLPTSAGSIAPVVVATHYRQNRPWLATAMTACVSLVLLTGLLGTGYYFANNLTWMDDGSTVNTASSNAVKPVPTFTSTPTPEATLTVATALLNSTALPNSTTTVEATVTSAPTPSISPSALATTKATNNIFSTNTASTGATTRIAPLGSPATQFVTNTPTASAIPTQAIQPGNDSGTGNNQSGNNQGSNNQNGNNQSSDNNSAPALPSPTPLPTNTPVQHPTSTWTPLPVPTNTVTLTPTHVLSPTLTSIITPSITVIITATATITGTATEQPTAAPTVLLTPIATLLFTPEGTIVGSLHTPTSTTTPEPDSEKMPQATVIEIVEPTGTNTTSTHSEGKPVGTYVPPRTNPLETPILDTTQFEQQDDEQLFTPISVTDTPNAQP